MMEGRFMSCCKEKAMRTRTKKRLYGLYTILGFLLGIAILSGLVFQSVYSAQSYASIKISPSRTPEMIIDKVLFSCSMWW